MTVMDLDKGFEKNSYFIVFLIFEQTITNYNFKYRARELRNGSVAFNASFSKRSRIKPNPPKKVHLRNLSIQQQKVLMAELRIKILQNEKDLELIRNKKSH